ncbi:MAG: ModE family transcriptional regulator [Nitrospirota bacterium]
MYKKSIHNRKKKISHPGFRGRIWIDGRKGTFLGYGRIILLERIREYGSITKAAKSMEMSYRHAWELVDSMNSQAARPLVKTLTGGKGGGGTYITKNGEKVIKLFWKFYADFHDFLKHEEKQLKFLIHQKGEEE